MNSNTVLDISWGTILKIGIAFLGFYILYLVRDILVWFVFALIISVLLSPVIDFLQRKRIPRVIATILVYVTIFGTLGIFVYFIADTFITEIQQFRQVLPQYFEKIAPPLRVLGVEALRTFDGFIQTLQGWLVGAAADIFSALAAIFGGIFAAITIFTLAFFLSLEENGVERAIKILSPKKQEQEVLNLWKSCQAKVSGWFGVRILVCLFVGVMSYIALWLFKINYPFVLALLAGVTNIIPVVGPIIAGVIIALIAALDSWLKAVLILIVFILIQQIEGSILTPVLTRKFIGLPPALVLISLLIGGNLWGILGAILAIPLAGIVFEFIANYLKKRKEDDVLPPTETPPPAGPKRSIIW